MHTHHQFMFVKLKAPIKDGENFSKRLFNTCHDKL